VTSSNLFRVIKHVLFLALLTLFVTGAVVGGFAASGQGTVQISLHGYGNIPGQLTNVVLQPGGSVSMIMTINNNMQTSLGSFPVTATAGWTGALTGSTLSGTIQNLAGKVQICVFGGCSTANFVGKGNWTGSIVNSAANGTFSGTITFTNTPFQQQLPANVAIPISGTWTAQISQ
jgi:hypothetical protein